MFLTAVRHEVDNLESSVVVQQLELAINIALYGFMEFRLPVQRRICVYKQKHRLYIMFDN